MAEAFLQTVIENLSSLIKEEIGLIMGVDDEMHKLSSTLTTIHAVLEDAEMKQIDSKPIQNWLRKLNDLTFEIDDVLDECATEVSILKHRNRLSRYSLERILYRHKVGRRMKQVTEKLGAVAAERDKFHLREMTVERPRGEVAASRETGSVLNEFDHVYGRDEEKDEIVDILVNKVDQDNGGISVIPIIGVGGLGKTTLAQLIFNDQRVVGHFEKRIWVCVSDNFDVKTLIKAMIESATGTGSASDLFHLDSLQRCLWKLLNQKKYLLVLDDVWNDHQEKWSALRDVLACGLSGSSIIVTTRMKKVADIMGTLPAHYLKGLSEEHCWMLIQERAFREDKREYPNLEAIGREIVKKCAGVPLAAKALGGLLRFKRTEKDWIYVKESELWDLPQEETSILPALKLSYHHLPLEVRQCFAYCAVFPKDSEVRKQELIFCWMAHGYISAKGTLEVEEVGNEIWNELVLRSLLQDVPDRSEPTFNMHDLVHDLAQSIMENKIPGTQVERNVRHASNSKVRQVNLQDKYEAFPKSYHQDMDLHSVLLKCSRLRILDASSIWSKEGRIKDVPSAVGNLKHLRYLNLSYSEICSLPNSLCSLWNLKTLNLNGSRHLVALPKNMRRLKNLRHLFLESCTSLQEMPPKIGELTCLRTLSLFIVGREKGNRLEELRFLNLGGKLEIRHLERMKNAMDARKSNFAEKPDLRYLELVWLERKDAFKFKGEDVDEKVLEALEPHPNLETLKINGFPGRRFSLWMAKSSILKKLVQIEIRDCQNCLRLPQLGELPHLKKLALKNLEVVEYITEDGDQAGNHHPVRSVLFPFLEKLTLHSLPNLKGLLKGQAVRAAFPQLRKLKIEDSSSLILIPPLPFLKKLVARRCSSSTLASFSNLHTLTTLELEIDKSMTPSGSIPIELLENLTNLKSLKIFGEHGALAVPEEGMRGLKSLRFLLISGSKTGACLPEGWFQHLSNLEELRIVNCREIVEVGEEIKYLHNLKTLVLFSLPKMASVPEAIQHLSSSLQSLTLFGLPQLKALPDWMGNLTSLHSLDIELCKELASLPDSIRGMVNLKRLSIWECPELVKRCGEEKGEDWHKIAHIPTLNIIKNDF